MLNVVSLTLRNGESALISPDDYERVSAHTWNVHRIKGRYPYVVAYIKGDQVHLHRFILGLKKGDRQFVDHADGNCLNNTRQNIRICTNSQNQWNRAAAPNFASPFKGVHKFRDQWKAGISVNDRFIHLGVFSNQYEAAFAYNEAARRYCGEFAKLNELPPEVERLIRKRWALLEKVREIEEQLCNN